MAHPGPPERIRDHPCCSDHDALAAWLAARSWEEVLASLREEPGDPVDFSSLSPRAFQYLTPAFLLLLAGHECTAPAPEESRAPHSVHPWAAGLLAFPEGAPHGPRFEAELAESVVPLYSARQLGAVRAVLTRLAGCTCLEAGDAARWGADVRRAVAEVWQPHPARRPVTGAGEHSD